MASLDALKARAADRAPPDWTPYWTGAGIGVLSWAAFVLAGDPLGITTALSGLAGLLVAPFGGMSAVLRNSYWAIDPPSLSYGSLLLLGVILGSFASALVYRQFHLESVPAVWRDRFGPSIMKRYAAAFLGGAVEMYGARLAGGCASGHGISGTLQLALSSWIFVVVVALAAIVTARLIFSGGRP